LAICEITVPGEALVDLPYHRNELLPLPLLLLLCWLCEKKFFSSQQVPEDVFVSQVTR